MISDDFFTGTPIHAVPAYPVFNTGTWIFPHGVVVMTNLRVIRKVNLKSSVVVALGFPMDATSIAESGYWALRWVRKFDLHGESFCIVQLRPDLRRNTSDRILCLRTR